MNRGCGKNRNCRNPLRGWRVRREEVAEKFDRQWVELRRHATIEHDPEKMIWLMAEIERRKRQAEIAAKRDT